MTEPLWVPNVKHVDVTKGLFQDPDTLVYERFWPEDFAIRPAMVFVHHFMQGGRSYIGRPDSGSRASAHFTANQIDTIVLEQNVPLNVCAWTNGSMNRPVWERAHEVPWSYRPDLRRNIQDCNAISFTMETAGFMRTASWMGKRTWLSKQARLYVVFGDPSQEDRYGRPMKDIPWAVIEAQIEATKIPFDLGLMDEDPSERTIIGHRHLDTVNRPQDPNDWWLRKYYPQIIAEVRGKQPRLPNPAQIERETQVDPAMRDSEIEELNARIVALESWKSEVETSAAVIVESVSKWS